MRRCAWDGVFPLSVYQSVFELAHSMHSGNDDYSFTLAGVIDNLSDDERETFYAESDIFENLFFKNGKRPTEPELNQAFVAAGLEAGE